MGQRRMEWTASDSRARAAQAGVTLELAEAGPSFEAGCRLLDEYFGPLGGMDDPQALRRLLTGPWRQGTTECRYHMVIARDDRRMVLGVVDCFTVIVDGSIGIGITNNAHVEPGARGRGIGSLLERAPSEQLRRTIATVGLPPSTPQLQYSYTYPLSSDDPSCVTRMKLWSSLGFRIVPFSVAPLHHLGQLDPSDRTRFLPPQPSLLIARNARPPCRRQMLSRRELHAFADAMSAVDSELVRDDAARIANIARLRQGIDGHPHDEVALLPMLGESRSFEQLSGLLRSCAFTGGRPHQSEVRWLASVLARRKGVGPRGEGCSPL